MIFPRMFFGFLLQITPFALLCFLPFVKQFRFSVRRTAALSAALFCGLGAAFALAVRILYDLLPHNLTLFNAANVAFLVMLAPCFLWYLYAVRTNWQKKLFAFSYAFTGAFIITSVTNTIITWTELVGSPLYDGLPYSGYTLPLLLALTAVFLPVLFLILLRFIRAVEDSFTRRECVYLSVLIVFLLMLLLQGVNYWGYDKLYNPMTILLYVTLLFSVFVIYAIFLKMLGIAHEKLAAQRRFDEAQRRLTIQEAQYRRITENVDAARRMRHDLRHHLLTLQGFLKNGETERAEQYLDQALELSEEYEIAGLCGSAVVNLIAGYYQALAREQGIAFSVRIAVPEEMPILDADLSVVLGNLLENALRAAAAEEEERFIRLNMICSGKMLAVTVDNSFNGTVRMSEGKYLSTKKGHTGYGLESVEAIAGKYSGGVEFTHEGRVFHSSVMMGMYVPEE